MSVNFLTESGSPLNFFPSWLEAQQSDRCVRLKTEHLALYCLRVVMLSFTTPFCLNHGEYCSRVMHICMRGDRADHGLAGV